MTDSEYKHLEKLFGYARQEDEAPIVKSKWQLFKESPWTFYLGVPLYMVAAVVIANYVGQLASLTFSVL
jgi:hypothetical protein